MYIRNQHTLLTDAFDGGYNSIDLKKSFFSSVKNFVKSNMKLLVEEGIPEKIILLGLRSSMPKMELLLFVTIPFLNKRLFGAYKAFLPSEVARLMDALIWEEFLTQGEIEKRLGFKVYAIKKSGYSGYEQSYIKSDFNFFRYKNTHRFNYRSATKYTLFIEPAVRRIMAIYYDAPEGANLEGITDNPETKHIYTRGEVDIFLELPRLLAYAQQGNIKTSTKGKPQVSTLGKMQRKLNLQEFYPNDSEKVLNLMRSNLLAGLITKLGRGVSSVELSVLVKMLIQSYYANQFETIHGVLNFLKGTGHIDTYYIKRVEPHFVQMLSEFPVGKWISIDNVLQYLKFNFIDIQPVKNHVAANKIYYSYAGEVKYGQYSYMENKHFIDASRYKNAIVIPTIKGTFFLFAAFGLLDIGYDEVDAEVVGQTCDSPYEGLRYIRLTNLGAYVAGKNTEYQLPDEIGKSSIELSSDSLTIISDENDPTAAVVLEPYTEKVSPNRFRTDFPTFLSGIANKKELADKITLFKQTVTADLPPNWQTFFKELERKIDPFGKVTNIKIFKIPTDNPDLIKLIARDATLKKLCFKAEGYHILVAKDKIARFKKRLREFGYLMS